MHLKMFVDGFIVFFGINNIGCVNGSRYGIFLADSSATSGERGVEWCIVPSEAPHSPSKLSALLVSPYEQFFILIPISNLLNDR